MAVNIDELSKLGYINLKVGEEINIPEQIDRLRRKKNAVILAHYYQDSEIQDIADFVGDSLGLSQQAEKTNADIIVFAGVHFMAETAKILNPEKKVIIPDMNAGCSLAASCPPEEFRKFREKYPDHKVVSYINSTVEIKAMTDIICTSSNAMAVVNSLPEEQKIIFAPDKNLGNYIRNITGRDMVVWDGACHVHEEFSLKSILRMKRLYPGAKVIVHPECRMPIQIIADHIGSTSSLLKFTVNDSAKEYIVATEPGIIHQMKKASPEKRFYPAEPDDPLCACSDCQFMKLITMKKIYNCLEYELPEITIEETLRQKAELPIRRMLEISKKPGI